MQMNGRLRHYEELALGRLRVRIKVRVDTNPLKRLPGILSKVHFGTNVLT